MLRLRLDVSPLLAHAIVAERVALLNSGKSPIEGPGIADYLAHRNLNFRANLDGSDAHKVYTLDLFGEDLTDA